MKIGVLGLQGSVKEHLKLIERNGDEGVIVKENDDLTTLDGLVIPGGESTTLNKLLKIKKLDEGIIEHS
ncbi:MAG: pyridoxal 5'-phosphate synthase glutaminase subunit PdxT, partial [Spirochaetales bacterium]|nr:pyridoxal 5'-phosphate synthase glutaminase subunit PdxT [Spirochaetales bacterium]